MWAEDLKGRLAAERRGEKERETATKHGGGGENTENAGRTKQQMKRTAAFRDRDLAEEATWQAVVLIPKGKGDFRGIGLVEVM